MTSPCGVVSCSVTGVSVVIGTTSVGTSTGYSCVGARSVHWGPPAGVACGPEATLGGVTDCCCVKRAILWMRSCNCPRSNWFSA
eukprot:129584-Amphidinium_carterae.1